MTSNESNYCSFQNEDDEKPQKMEDDGNDFTFLSVLKCEDEENGSKCFTSLELTDVDASFPPVSIKTEPEDPQYEVQLQAENVAVKEEADIEEHEPGWERAGRSSSGTFKSSENQSEEKGNYYCAFCPYKTNEKSEYVRHYACNHLQQKIEVYKCAECSYETMRKCDLLSHYKYKHAKDVEVYRCQECSYESRNKWLLIRHCKHKHSKDVKLYKCEECSYKTRIKYNLNQHKYKHSEEAGVLKCEECSHETRYKEALKIHYKYKHAKEKETYKCQECWYETKYKTVLTRHYKCKHNTSGKKLMEK